MNKKRNKGSGNHHNGQTLQGFGSHIQMLEPEVKHLIWFEETNSNHRFPSCSLKNIFFSTLIQGCYTSGFLFVDWNFWKAPENLLVFLCLVLCFDLFGGLLNSLPRVKYLVSFFMLFSILKQSLSPAELVLLCFSFQERRLGSIKPLQHWSEWVSHWAPTAFMLSLSMLQNLNKILRNIHWDYYQMQLVLSFKFK